MILCSHLNRCCAKIVQRKRANVSLQCLWGKKSGADPETDKSSCPVRGCTTEMQKVIKIAEIDFWPKKLAPKKGPKMTQNSPKLTQNCQKLPKNDPTLPKN